MEHWIFKNESQEGRQNSLKQDKFRSKIRKKTSCSVETMNMCIVIIG